LAVELARSDDQGVHGACRRCSSAAVTGALNTLRPNSNHPKTVKALPDNIILYSSRSVSRVYSNAWKSKRKEGGHLRFKTACAQPDVRKHFAILTLL